MALNPTSALADDLHRSIPSIDEFSSMEESIRFASLPPESLNNGNGRLRYIMYQPFVEKYSIATAHEFDTEQDAERHWEIQKRYDERYFLRPERCVLHNGKYLLVFPKIIRLFKVWVQEHTKRRVTDADIWEILKKLGENMMYLVESDRPHGNLLEGVGVTTDLKPLFFNLVADTGALIYQRDAEALQEILKNVEPKLKHVVIKEHVAKWIQFLTLSCSGASPYLPRYSSDHVKFVFGYAISWNADSKRRFLANMSRLCRDKDASRSKLIDNTQFMASLSRHYSNWPAAVTSDIGPTAFKEVYTYGYARGFYDRQAPGTNTVVVSEASIVIFAHYCVEHFEAVRPLPWTEILTRLYLKFPHLIEHIYEAFYTALASGGYRLPTSITVAQVLTGRL